MDPNVFFSLYCNFFSFFDSFLTFFALINHFFVSTSVYFFLFYYYFLCLIFVITISLLHLFHPIGIRFIQQWDDIILEQRRNYFLTWPKVIPSDLISNYSKCIEIKWASIFNLNILNLRSTLGLSVLHTTVYSGKNIIVVVIMIIILYCNYCFLLQLLPC